MSETLASWNALPHISQAVPLSDADASLVQELTDVLKKYNALDRFGLTLLHKHFAFADDEVLLETTDVETRTQTMRPIPKSEATAADIIETAWHLRGGKPLVACVCSGSGSDHIHFPDGQVKVNGE
jgi:hypothetical protein